MSDDLTKAQRRKNMQHIRSKDTKIEVLLRKALWHKGIRYRKNYSKVLGTPDIAITKYKIAIFCDGEFFHGKDWEQLEPRLLKGDHGEYWVHKIDVNRRRDEETNKELYGQGWTVLRFWGKDIEKNLDDCVRAVEDIIFDSKINDTEDITGS